MKKVIASLFLFAAAICATSTAHAQASDPFLGQIMYVGFTFCPQGWAEANGQLLPIQQNTALFALLGTTYGGDGQTTFALPDLRGRVPVHTGQGPGLSNYVEGQTGGAETETLSISNIPPHTHSLNAIEGVAGKTDPTNHFLAGAGAYRATGTATTLNPQSVGVTGGGQPFNIEQPYLTLKACIALVGVFPSRP